VALAHTVQPFLSCGMCRLGHESDSNTLITIWKTHLIKKTSAFLLLYFTSSWDSSNLTTPVGRGDFSFLRRWPWGVLTPLCCAAPLLIGGDDHKTQRCPCYLVKFTVPWILSSACPHLRLRPLALRKGLWALVGILIPHAYLFLQWWGWNPGHARHLLCHWAIALILCT
jgi:hypothetical protein